MNTSASDVAAAPTREIIGLLPRTLMWVTDGKEFESVELRYAMTVSKALGCLLARLRTESPGLAESITKRLSQAPKYTIARVLLSPSVSERLLWGVEPAAGIARLLEIGQFLESCLGVEEHVQGSHTGSLLPMWGALGDCVLRDAGEVFRWDPVGGRLPIDLESPDVIAVGSGPPPEVLGSTPLAREEQRAALEALTEAHRLVRSGSASLRVLIDNCAKVVVMRKKQSNWFSSFSSCRFVGRITLVNPQIVDESMIAEALVHEAIHAYLYMQEPTPFWGLNPGVCDEEGVVCSPWTGRSLSLTSYLHACFVWYGLFFFWGQVMCSSLWPTDEVRRGIARASCGFMKGALLDYLGPERIGLVQQDVQAAVAELQHNVLTLVA